MPDVPDRQQHPTISNGLSLQLGDAPRRGGALSQLTDRDYTNDDHPDTIELNTRCS